MTESAFIKEIVTHTSKGKNEKKRKLDETEIKYPVESVFVLSK